MSIEIVLSKTFHIKKSFCQPSYSRIYCPSFRKLFHGTFGLWNEQDSYQYGVFCKGCVIDCFANAKSEVRHLSGNAWGQL